MRFLLTTVWVCLLPCLIFGFGGGTGLPGDPYIVETAEHLNEVRNHLDAHFRQNGNIDLTDFQSPDGAGYNDGAGWDPLGWYQGHYENEPFTGSYDGDGFTISNLYMDRGDELYFYHGLFGYASSSANLLNITLVDVDITGCRVGGLVGRMAGDIDNCHVSGEVTGYTAGGLANEVLSQEVTRNVISNSSASCNVTGDFRAGGLIFIAEYSRITNCSVSGEVYSLGPAAGLVFGIGMYSIVEFSHSSCNIIATGNGGGLVGGASASIIQESYATGDLTVNPYTDTYYSSLAGGLIAGGENTDLINCYTLVNITGIDDVYTGGFIGALGMNTVINNSYAAGVIQSDYTSGGLVGKCYSNTGISVSNSFWDYFMTGEPYSILGEGRTTPEMMQQDTFTAWDFQDIWQIDENQSYPYLRNNPPPDIPAPVQRTNDLGALRVVGDQHIFADSLVTYSVLVYNVGSNPQSDFLVRLLAEDDQELNSLIVTETLNQYEQIEIDLSWIAGEPGSFYNLRGEVILDNDEYGYNNQTGILTAHVHIGFDQGDGTADNPYQISHPDQFYLVKHFMDAHFEQTADLDLSQSTFEGHWEAIGYYHYGSENEPFAGVYRGNDHTITNFIFVHPTQGTYSASVFACISPESIIRDLHIENIVIDDLNNNFSLFGGLVGINEGSIINCSLKNITIPVNTFSINFGGLVAINEGTITDSSIEFILEGGDSIYTYYPSGGLVGENHGTILRSYAYINLDVDAHIIGGLAGLNTGIIDQSYAIGSVHATEQVGGLIGRNEGSVFNSYNLATTSGWSIVGGLIGRAQSSSHVENCFSAGSVSNGGGLMGVNFGTVISSYWDIQTSNQTYSAGGEGRSTFAMKRQVTFVDWDFEEIWDIIEHESYPYLHYQEGPLNTEDAEHIQPQTTKLLGNYPNPFNPETLINFYLAQNGAVTLDIYNIRGQRVRRLVDAHLERGEHQIRWDGIDDTGRNVSSGVYFYRLMTDDHIDIKKMLLLK